MKIIQDMRLDKFNAWAGAVETQERIIKEGKEIWFEHEIEELYPEGLTDTELNDLLWFEEEWIYDLLGITEEEEEE
jgi:hypothetical protein